jgi:hypothetical protein
MGKPSEEDLSFISNLDAKKYVASLKVLKIFPKLGKTKIINFKCIEI